MSKFDLKYMPDPILRLDDEAQTANFTAENGKLYKVTPTGTLNVQLPAPAKNLHFAVKDLSGDLTTNSIVLVRNGAENIDGQAANYTMDVDNQALVIYSDGTDWFIVTNTAGAGGATTLPELTDVNFPTTLADGEVLTYNAGVWENAAPASSGANTSLSNLTATSINQNLLPDTPTSTIYRNIGASSPREKRFRRAYFDVELCVGIVDVSGSDQLCMRHAFNSPYYSGTLSIEGQGSRTLSFHTENKSSTTPSSRVAIQTGDTVDGTSGQIAIRTGLPSGTGNSGSVFIQTGVAPTGTRGDILLDTAADKAKLQYQPTGSTPLAIATTKYVDDNTLGLISDAPNDGTEYLRANQTWRAPIVVRGDHGINPGEVNSVITSLTTPVIDYNGMVIQYTMEVDTDGFGNYGFETGTLRAVWDTGIGGTNNVTVTKDPNNVVLGAANAITFGATNDGTNVNITYSSGANEIGAIYMSITRLGPGQSI